MNEQLKKRLIGVTVLVALAVIFVPMLFESDGEQSTASLDSNIPPKPDYPAQTIEIPLQLPADGEAVEQRVVDSAEQATAYEQTTSAAPANTGTAPKEASSPALIPVSAGTESLATAPPVALPPPTPEKIQVSAAIKPATVLPEKKPEPVSAAKGVAHGWVVQLGSFGKAENAIALRDKVRKQGIAAYVEQVKAGGALSYRVRVGPELKRENAEALKKKIAGKLGMQGTVMPHP